MAEHGVACFRRLVNAITGLYAGLTDPLIIECDPALENIDELEIELMSMLIRGLHDVASSADDMGVKAPTFHPGSPKIAILEKFSETFGLVCLRNGSSHGWYPPSLAIKF